MIDQSVPQLTLPKQTASQLIQLGEIPGYAYSCIARVYSPTGLCPTLTSMAGGDRQPKILVKGKKEDGSKIHDGHSWPV